MNLDLLKQPEKRVQTSEKYPSTPVITLLAEDAGTKEKTTKMLRFNMNALNTLNIGGIGREDYNRIIAFDEYLVSNPDESDRFDVVMFVTNQKTIKADKAYKAYEIALGTKKCMSSEIYDMLVKRFNLDTTIDNYIELVQTHDRTGGAYTFKLLENNTEKEFTSGSDFDVEKVFNKGEDRPVEMIQH
jgi:hypothetical protein